MDIKKKPNCAILGCLKQFNVKRHYFKFPKEQDRWLKWVDACKRFDLIDKGPQYSSDNIRLCHLHFEEKLFRINKVRASLHPDAVPTLLLGRNTNQQDNTNEITKQNVSTEKEELCSNTYAEETIKVEEENSITYAEEAVRIEEENNNTYAEGAIKVEEENSNTYAEGAIKVEEENSNTCAEGAIKVEEENSNTNAEEAIKVKEENSSAKTSKIILLTCHSSASNFGIKIMKLGTSAEKPGTSLVATHTKKSLDASFEIKKLRKQVKRLKTRNNTLRTQIRRLHAKEKKRKSVITSRQAEYNNLRELGRKLLPEDFNRLLTAQIDKCTM